MDAGPLAGIRWVQRKRGAEHAGREAAVQGEAQVDLLEVLTGTGGLQGDRQQESEYLPPLARVHIPEPWRDPMTLTTQCLALDSPGRGRQGEVWGCSWRPNLSLGSSQAQVAFRVLIARV